MPFLLLDDATQEAQRRLHEFGENALQGAFQPIQQQAQQGLQDITGRLQDFGTQQLQSLQQATQQSPPMQSLDIGGGLQDITQRLQDFGQQQLSNAQQQIQQIQQQVSQPFDQTQPGGDLQDYARKMATKYRGRKIALSG